MKKFIEGERPLRVLIKGAGDLASGIAVRLYHSGFQVIMTETGEPTTIRRYVAFSRAVYESEAEVEGIIAKCVSTKEALESCLEQQKIPVITDPTCVHMDWYQPDVEVDAILAKRNLGTKIEDAPIVIGVGPGFTAGIDCHFVVETKRGHDLGRVITEGTAIPNTGVPGVIAGYAKERLICASGEGRFEPKAEIGDCVEKGQLVAMCGKNPVYAQMSGMIRGMLPEGIVVSKGMKCGDIDARSEYAYCFTISDKARAVGGGVLEAILRGRKQIAENRNREFDA